MVSLRYFAPAEDVRDIVSLYYLMEVSDPKLVDHERAAIAQLRFALEGSGKMGFGDGPLTSSPKTMLVGPTTSASKFEINGPFRMFGVGLLPLGWSAITNKSAADYADKSFAARDVFTAEIDNFMPVLRGCKNAEEMTEWANRAFRDLRPRIKPEIAEFTQMVDEWLSSEPSPPVSGLMEKSTLSSRQVLRLVNKLYGMPPKFLARKYRALRAARAFAEGNQAELLDLENAFYDQSHMIREVKLFAGVTPTKLRVGEGEVATLIDQRSDLKGRIAPLISDT